MKISFKACPNVDSPNLAYNQESLIIVDESIFKILLGHWLLKHQFELEYFGHVAFKLDCFQACQIPAKVEIQNCL